ncbi:NmrA family transcriptional regulator [Burkholderia multivorans]|uniref:NmrA family NAD(P)-binding protein n=1 Tax=Burkholderia multivorans TaxID=87883 RepID=UPI000DAB89E8|nr:NAD(P)H-binding protein [Burkholderia multivorans]RAA27381.1 NmrA family transcriptional regulator [Burkholderia multivorans]RAA35395.1 NmrA family transcriptional regulator [Burkholderia multivorans]RAA40472.1 NmrA family transcriptional regulator [Burkholderia multivorans]RAA47348.1 NmrA family transcriptional regulator [Burkholderia multivorans]RAA54732.1 NmrA family transcriptional regulator [Burkholderia multivorans]
MFVIFGASGHVGLATVTALRAAGHPVRAVLREPRGRERFAQLGCDVAIADLADPRAVAAALDGAHGVQMLCPVPARDADPAATMARTIEVAVEALGAHPPDVLLALSDYGAELEGNTGITRVFRDFEARLKTVPTQLTLLRSAEHLQNWARMLPVALATGALPSLHHPVDRMFPAVWAPDVGEIAAQLLTEHGERASTPRIVSVEGPRRVSARDIAAALGAAAGRDVVAHPLPRDAWTPTLLRAGLSARHAELIVDLYDVHNAGRIDFEPGSERRFGTTMPADALAALLRAHA